MFLRKPYFFDNVRTDAPAIETEHPVEADDESDSDDESNSDDESDSDDAKPQKEITWREMQRRRRPHVRPDDEYDDDDWSNFSYYRSDFY